MIHYSGIVAAWVGEKDLALQNLAKAAQLPCFLSYGRLKLLPWYDPLRGDPRFEKIVADLHQRVNRESSRLVICHVTSSPFRVAHAPRV